MTSIAGLVLAAGFARRFGSDKRQAVMPDGRTLLGASLAGVYPRLPRVWLVVQPADEPEALGVPAEVTVVRHPVGDQGLGHSLASGMRAIARDANAYAVAVFLGDMPWIAGETLERVYAAAAADRIVQPVYQGQPGHPVIFGRHFWPELLQLGGDTGARSVLQAHPGAVLKIQVDDPGVLRDVDTPAALG